MTGYNGKMFLGVNKRFDQMYERIRFMTCWTAGTLALLGRL